GCPERRKCEILRRNGVRKCNLQNLGVQRDLRQKKNRLDRKPKRIKTKKMVGTERFELSTF
ncbi:MAG: hypothetical protein WCS73_07395, partial [Lentisphaeria bacterium]